MSLQLFYIPLWLFCVFVVVLYPFALTQPLLVSLFAAVCFSMWSLCLFTVILSLPVVILQLFLAFFYLYLWSLSVSLSLCATLNCILFLSLINFIAVMLCLFVIVFCLFVVNTCLFVLVASLFVAISCLRGHLALHY